MGLHGEAVSVGLICKWPVLYNKTTFLMCKDIGQYEINIGEWGSTEQGCRVTPLNGQPETGPWTNTARGITPAG